MGCQWAKFGAVVGRICGGTGAGIGSGLQRPILDGRLGGQAPRRLPVMAVKEVLQHLKPPFLQKCYIVLRERVGTISDARFLLLTELR